MNRKLSLLLALLLTLPLFAEETQRYLVATKSKPSRLRLVANAQSAARHGVRTFREMNAFAADLTASEVAELRRSSDVALVEPIVERHAFAEYDVQVTSWGLPAVHAQDVWPVTKGENINVAVLDTGIDINHPDLQGAYVGGYNVWTPADPPQDDNSHGTHVAGIIAARNNGFGVVGVAPAAKIWGVKVLNANGEGSNETVVAGIDWVVARKKESGGLWVINMSLGSNTASDIEKAAVNRAIEDGIVVVAAAGNRPDGFVRFPAGYDNVISVGAIDAESKKAEFSSYGPGLSVMGPGVAVPSTLLKGVTKSADVISTDLTVPGWGVTGSPFAEAKGAFLAAGLGKPEEIPWNMAGRVALIRRGEIPFREKARNAKEAGAVAVVIINNEPPGNHAENWTMYPPGGPDGEWVDYVFPLTVGVPLEIGDQLLALTQNVEVEYREDAYGKLNGTSMASPHVAGMAALMLAAAPNTPVLQIKYALERSAIDLDAAGWDPLTGWGAADAFAAAKYVAPEKFGVPRPDPTPTRRRRAVQ